MLSDERTKKLRKYVYKIHDSIAEAVASADLSNEERHIVLCTVVAHIQDEIIKYLEHELD